MIKKLRTASNEMSSAIFDIIAKHNIHNARDVLLSVNDAKYDLLRLFFKEGTPDYDILTALKQASSLDAEMTKKTWQLLGQESLK